MKLKLDKVLMAIIFMATVASVEASEIEYPPTVTLTARVTDTNVEEPTDKKYSIDHHYNTIIKRVIKKDTDTSSYPKVQSWNKDMTLIRISSRLYDANTLEESNLTSKYTTNSTAYKGLCSRYSDYFRWSNIDADTFYVLNSSHQFIKGVIDERQINCSNELDAFSDYELIHIGPYEGNIDFNDKYVLFVAKKVKDDDVYLILFDIENEERVWTKILDNNSWIEENGKWKVSSLDWISVTPSGNHILMNEYDRNGAVGGMYVYDMELKNKVKLQFEYKGKLYAQGGHADIGFDMQGNEVLVQFIGGLGVYQFSLDNPKELGKKILNLYGGGHVSCRNSERKGWCYISTHAENYRDVFALKLDGSDDENVQNYTQAHMVVDLDKIYGAPSPDGSRVIFNSDWGSNNLDDMGTFVVTTY